MKRILRLYHTSIFLFIFCIPVFVQGQTPISGVINEYKQVITADFPTGTLTLNSVTNLNIGDTVLIIQMRGAEINQSNDQFYGDVVNAHASGTFELNTVCEINGNSVVFFKQFRHIYNEVGNVQVLPIPKYTDALVTDTLTCPAWNGTTGGVLFFQVSGTLTLNADIDVSGKGFRGGAHYQSTFNCNSSTNLPNYAYDVTSGRGAAKGEGIASFVSVDGGRGAFGNGGGGGNDHNAGGAGGGNVTNGGNGGDNDDPGGFTCKGYYPGVGGKAVPTDNFRTYMGGGGGAGHSNSQWDDSGGDGGGIVIVIANDIEGNGYTIRSNGTRGLDGFGDGSGGGGAGGSMLLDVANYTGNLALEAIGGDGGDSDGFSSDRCFGPGGGGSGGFVRSTAASLPGNVTASLGGGSHGVVGNTTNPCAGLGQNSTAGQPGTIHYNSEIKTGIKGNNSCGLLPQVDLGGTIKVCVNDSVTLDSGHPTLDILWSTGDTTSTIVVTAEGQYWVQVDDGQCPICDTVVVDYVEYPLPLADDLVQVCNGDPVSVDAGNDPGGVYNWSIGATDQIVEIFDPGIYTVTITFDNTCSITDTVEVVLCPEEIVIPNTITPNGDGNNDTWVVTGIQQYPTNEVKIFNRDGNIVFETVNYQNDWDGAGLPAAVYYYIIDFNHGGNLQTGSITILRER
jgi:gliding motility-associated-like protein